MTSDDYIKALFEVLNRFGIRHYPDAEQEIDFPGFVVVYDYVPLETKLRWNIANENPFKVGWLRTNEEIGYKLQSCFREAYGTLLRSETLNDVIGTELSTLIENEEYAKRSSDTHSTGDGPEKLTLPDLVLTQWTFSISNEYLHADPLSPASSIQTPTYRRNNEWNQFSSVLDICSYGPFIGVGPEVTESVVHSIINGGKEAIPAVDDTYSDGYYFKMPLFASGYHGHCFVMARFDETVVDHADLGFELARVTQTRAAHALAERIDTAINNLDGHIEVNAIATYFVECLSPIKEVVVEDLDTGAICKHCIEWDDENEFWRSFNVSTEAPRASPIKKCLAHSISQEISIGAKNFAVSISTIDNNATHPAFTDVDRCRDRVNFFVAKLISSEKTVSLGLLDLTSQIQALSDHFLAIEATDAARDREGKIGDADTYKFLILVVTVYCLECKLETFDFNRTTLKTLLKQIDWTKALSIVEKRSFVGFRRLDFLGILDEKWLTMNGVRIEQRRPSVKQGCLLKIATAKRPEQPAAPSLEMIAKS